MDISVSADDSRNLQSRTSSLHRNWWLIPLVIFLFSRAIIFPSAYMSQYFLPEDWRVNHQERSDNYPMTGKLGMWIRWDAIWYISIADVGYAYVPGDRSTGFFPAYPLAIKAVTPSTGNNSIAAALLVNNLFFLASLMVLYRLIQQHFSPKKEVISRTLLYIAIYPSAMHFAAPYTEGMFLFLSIVVIYAAKERKWWLAGLAGGIASATRVPGLLLMIPVGLEWAASKGWTLSTLHKREAWVNLLDGFRHDFGTVLLLAVTMPLGLVSYMVYLWQTFGDPLAFYNIVHGGPAPHRTFATNIDAIVQGDFRFSVFWLGVIAAICFVILTYFIWQRFGAGLGLYCLISLLIPISGSIFTGIPRYTSVLFPAFILIGMWGHKRWVHRLIVFTWPLGLAISTFFYVQFVKV